MHDTSEASKTALMVCAYRARASSRERPLCSDPWAAQLAGPEGLALAQRFDEVYPHMELWMALRTRLLDAHVQHWTGADRGFRQVVLLGAGFDTRAQRLATEGVRFYEVDHPATQAIKRDRLARLEHYPSDAAVYAPCDFEAGQDFLAQLAQVGFEPERPSLVLWEGVVPYLSEDAVRGTARRIAGACSPETVLLFDFLGKQLAHGTKLTPKDQQARDYVGDLDEPIRFGTNDILPLLSEVGFRHVHVLNFDEICLSLTGSYDRTRQFRFQYVAMTSRTVYGVLEQRSSAGLS